MAGRVPNMSVSKRIPRRNCEVLLKKAEEFQLIQNLPKSFKYYVAYFECLEDATLSAPAVQVAFTKLVCEMGNILQEIEDSVELLLKCYLQAINIFPNNYIILNSLGAYMLKLNEPEIACRYLESAVKVNKNYLPAEKNLLQVKWHQVPRWHFRMLNDKNRNLAYFHAIQSAISQGYTDVIDVGAGAGLLSLIASGSVDVNITAIEENRTMFKILEQVVKENNVTNITLMNCNSTDLDTSPAPCNLLITEIFDVALFGERAVDTLLHAFSVLLPSSNFKIIPAGAKVYVTGIESLQLSGKHRYVRNLPDLNLNNICIHQNDPEPYDAEYLTEKNVKYITNTELITSVNFYSVSQLHDLLCDENHSSNIKIKCNKEGVLHALTVWFDLELDSESTITTNPLKPDCLKCWEQAVFYLDHPISLKENDSINVKATMYDSQLKLSITDQIIECASCFEVSSDIISFLNDEKWVDSIVKLANNFNDTTMKVLDCNVFPLFGFLMAKKGCVVYHIYKDGTSQKLFQHIAQTNNINTMTFLDEKFFVSHSLVSEEIDIVFLDPIGVDGSWNKTLISEDKLREWDIIVLPEKYVTNVQLVSSSYINHCNKVDDDNALGFKMAKFMNEYTGNEHPNIENFTCTKLSEPIKFDNTGEYYEKTSNLTVTETGSANALYYWFDIHLSEDIVLSTLDSTYFCQSCFILDEPKPVKIGDVCEIKIKREDSYMKISIN